MHKVFLKGKLTRLHKHPLTQTFPVNSNLLLTQHFIRPLMFTLRVKPVHLSQTRPNFDPTAVFFICDKQ